MSASCLVLERAGEDGRIRQPCLQLAAAAEPISAGLLGARAEQGQGGREGGAGWQRAGVTVTGPAHVSRNFTCLSVSWQG